MGGTVIMLPFTSDSACTLRANIGPSSVLHHASDILIVRYVSFHGDVARF